jgi:hypothetical protein
MGTAFDYAFRFTLSGRTGTRMGRLVAESAVGMVAGPRLGPELAPDSLTQRLAAALRRAEQLRVLAPPSDEALEACFVLAELDVIMRAGLHWYREHTVEVSELEELRALLALVPWPDFEGLEYEVLNPHFREGSRLLGGADGDLLVDDLLVDIKTRKDAHLAIEDVRQCVCYALLANRYRVGGLDQEERGRWPSSRTVAAIGLYHARAGRMHHFELHECLRPQDEEKVLRVIGAWE